MKNNHEKKIGQSPQNNKEEPHLKEKNNLEKPFL